MKIMLLGASGFIGRNVKDILSKDHELIAATHGQGKLGVNLLEPDTIIKLIKATHPQIIINCAGIVDNSEDAMQNVAFTTNLIEAAHASGLKFERIIISGSAAVYGYVDEKNIPVRENAPLNATQGYGLSKLKEEEAAQQLGEKYNFPIVIARIFNPIGAGMHERFLIPKILKQVKEFKEGSKDSVEVSRLDSKRDYVDIKDIAEAIKCLVEKDPKAKVYNIGSGKSTSNAELVNYVIKLSDVAKRPEIIESNTEPEPLVAIQADISRLRDEFDWEPIHSIEETIKEIIDATGK